MAKSKEARALMEQIYKSNADLKADHQNNILNISINHLSALGRNIILFMLSEYLNERKLSLVVPT